MKTIVGEAKALLEMLDQFQLEEIQLETEGLRFRAVRAGVAPAAPAVAAAGGATLEPVAAPREAAPPPRAPGTPIVSPMVGVFYRSSSPDKPAFVAVGDSVEPETTVCIIEAMKLMNEIKAGVRGRVVDCPVANETPVKAGQPLFFVEPA